MIAQVMAYIALSIGLLAMSMKEMLLLRSLHALSCIMYGVYGLYIDAVPLTVGAFLYALIHLAFITKHLISNRLNE